MFIFSLVPLVAGVASRQLTKGMIFKGNLTMTEQNWYQRVFGKSNIVTPPNQTLFPINQPVDCDRQLKIVAALKEKHFSKAKNTFQETRDKLTQLQEMTQLVNKVRGVI